MSLYGLILGICIVIISRFFSKNNTTIPKNQEGIFLFFLSLSALTGARLYHLLDNWQFYIQNPDQILNTRAGGLGIFGALFGILFYIFIYSRITKLSFVDIADSIIPIVPLSQSIGRWGNFFNKEGFGIPTLSSFGQFIPSHLRPQQYQIYSHFHPVWLYESILTLILFLIIRKTKYHQISFYLIGYGIIRFITEFYRFDTWTINQVKIAQVISLLFIIIGSLTIIVDKFTPPTEPD